MREDESSQSEILKSIEVPSRLGRVGYGIVLVAFLLAAINALLPSPIAILGAVLQPFIFVGIASLLYHIGQHVHVMHQNAVRMILMEQMREREHQM